MDLPFQTVANVFTGKTKNNGQELHLDETTPRKIIQRNATS